MPLPSELPQLIRAKVWVPIQELTKGLSGHCAESLTLGSALLDSPSQATREYDGKGHDGQRKHTTEHS